MVGQAEGKALFKPFSPAALHQDTSPIVRACRLGHCDAAHRIIFHGQCGAGVFLSQEIGNENQRIRLSRGSHGAGTSTTRLAAPSLEPKALQLDPAGRQVLLASGQGVMCA